MVTARGGSPGVGRLPPIQEDASVPHACPSPRYWLAGGEVGIRAYIPLGFPGNVNLYQPSARVPSQF